MRVCAKNAGGGGGDIFAGHYGNYVRKQLATANISQVSNLLIVTLINMIAENLRSVAVSKQTYIHTCAIQSASVGRAQVHQHSTQ